MLSSGSWNDGDACLFIVSLIVQMLDISPRDIWPNSGRSSMYFVFTLLRAEFLLLKHAIEAQSGDLVCYFTNASVASA